MQRVLSEVIIALMFAVLMSVPSVLAECIAPFDEMILSSSRELCAGEFEASNIRIEGSGTEVGCNGTVLKGKGDNAGFLIDFAESIAIRGCTIENFEAGISVRGSRNIILEDNTFTGNKIGVSEQGSGVIQRNNVFEGSIRQDVLSIEGAIDLPEPVEEPLLKPLLPSAILRKQVVLRNPGMSVQEVQTQVDELIKRSDLSQELIDITRTVAIDPETNTTTVTLTISPKQELKEAYVYEGIPKCLAEYLSQVVFSNGDFETIEEDPLIMWSFSGMSEKTKLTYKVRKVITEECADLLTGFGIATPLTVPKKKEKEVPKETEKSSMVIGILVVLFMATILHRAAWRRGNKRE